jgi:nucleoside-diphosphate-sugar epimerase
MASLPFELKRKSVYVVGHRGMVGSALVRRLAGEGVELLTATRSEADLRDQAAVNRFARVVAATVGYTGTISFDASRPDGPPRKLLDVSRLAKLGWRASISLVDGIGLAYQAYLNETRGR